MEQTVHTNTDLNGKLTATQLRQVFHWILYRSERRLSEWWRHRLSRWCQLCGWCVCVCVCCVRECVCVKRSRLSTHCRSFCTSSTLMNVQLRETRRVQNYAGRLLSCGRVSHLYRRDVEPWHHPNTHQEGFNNKHNKRKLQRFGSACSTLLFILFLFLFLSVFFFLLSVWSGHQCVRQEGKSSFVFFLYRGGFPSPRSQTGFSDSTAAPSLTVTGSRPRVVR